MPPPQKEQRVRVSDDRRRGETYMADVVASLPAAAPGGREAALNHAAWVLGRWIAGGALKQGDAEDAIYAAAERNSLVADDGQRQTWATITSGLSAGLHCPDRIGRRTVTPRLSLGVLTGLQRCEHLAIVVENSWLAQKSLDAPGDCRRS